MNPAYERASSDAQALGQRMQRCFAHHGKWGQERMVEDIDRALQEKWDAAYASWKGA